MFRMPFDYLCSDPDVLVQALPWEDVQIRTPGGKVFIMMCPERYASLTADEPSEENKVLRRRILPNEKTD